MSYRNSERQIRNEWERSKPDAVCIVCGTISGNLEVIDLGIHGKLFDKWNVAFVSVTQEINTHTPAKQMMLNILVTFAQFEREVITERVRDKMAASRRKGKWVGGTVPYGYRVENRRLVPDEAEAAVVRRIYGRYLEVQSPKLIASELNAEGIPNHNGRRWDTQSIHRIMTNHHYVGEVEYQGAVYEGEHDGIVERELWDRCREIMSGDAPKPDRSRSGSEPALLQGVLRCGHCQSAMSPVRATRRGRSYLYYACLHSARHPDCGCPVRHLPAAEVEGQVLAQLGKALASPEIVAGVSRQTGVPGHEVLGRFSDGFWEAASPGERQRLARLLLESVTIFPDSLKLELRTAGLKSVAEAYAN